MTPLERWDVTWQGFYDQGRAQHMTPNAAIHRANRLMDLRGFGDRPVETQPEETQK